MNLSLPWPPSVNKYWRHNRGRTHISKEGRAYRDEVWWLIQSKKLATITQPAFIYITAYPPDKRKRDLDNLLKCLIDSIAYSGAIADDYLFDDIRITRGPMVVGGRLAVTFGVISNPQE